MSNLHNQSQVHDAISATRAKKGLVLLVDDDLLFLDSISAFLQSEGYLTLSFSSAMHLLDHLENHLNSISTPCCILSDVDMPDMEGFELLCRIEKYLHIPFMFMSGVSKLENVVNGFRSGAIDFLIKPIDSPALLTAIDKALIKSEQITQNFDERGRWEFLMSSLTSRELAVIRLVGQGYLNKQIADELQIALRTTKLYRQSAMKKLGLEKVTELASLFDAGYLS